MVVCSLRSTAEACIHTQGAKRRICEHLIEEGSDPARLVAAGAQLLAKAAEFKAEFKTWHEEP